jgi:hypothetical protein
MSKSSKSSVQKSQKGQRSNKKVIMPELPAEARRKFLEDLSDADLDDLYFSTFGKDPDEILDAKTKIDQIESQLPEPPKTVPAELQKTDAQRKAERKRAGKTLFKSSETGKEFELSGDLSGHMVVRQVSVRQDNGGMYEVPNTETVQSYRPEVFEDMMERNFFSESQLKIEILQDAR